MKLNDVWNTQLLNKVLSECVRRKKDFTVILPTEDWSKTRSVPWSRSGSRTAPPGCGLSPACFCLSLRRSVAARCRCVSVQRERAAAYISSDARPRDHALRGHMGPVCPLSKLYICPTEYVLFIDYLTGELILVIDRWWCWLLADGGCFAVPDYWYKI